MIPAPLRTLRSVEPRAGHKLAVAWDDGTHMVVDLSENIRRGGVFAPLADEAAFARVRVDDRHRKILWPEPLWHGEPLIDIDAESLFVMGAQQSNRGLLERVRHAIRSFERNRKLADTVQSE